jgi:AcrR family transcriptional regulator
MSTESAAIRGRPRNAALDERILQVALRHLARNGYYGMSMEQVAVDAGVGKATLYRRYRNKADLATAALVSITAPEFEQPLPDGTREALLDHLERFERGVSRGGIDVLGALLSRQSDPELLDLHRQRVISRGKARLAAILERARERGEIRADADFDAAIEMLIGSYFARRLAGGPEEGWAETVVDTLLRGITLRAA